MAMIETHGVWLCKIETIQPTSFANDERSADEQWFIRKTVRTFKVAGETQSDAEKLADQLLKAYLECHGGIGSWTLTSWIVR